MAKLFVLAIAIVFACGSVIAQDEFVTEVSPETTPVAETTPAPPVTNPAPPITTPAPDTTPAPIPDTTPAPIPDTTPVPIPETTLTPEPDTTLAPDTTTPPATTPAPIPQADFKYNITEDNVTCIMIEGAISFTVNYSVSINETKLATITIPKHPKAGFQVSGTCNGSSGQQIIEVTWGGEHASSMEMVFVGNEKQWNISTFTASLYLDPAVFANGSAVAGKTLAMVIDYGFSPLTVAYNHSFNCHSDLSAVNITGTIDSVLYKLPISSKLDGIQIQAFNEIPNEPDFVNSVHCSADEVSDVVPIAVGCALAALVVIVLIAYLVGRRRRSAAYQSV